MFASESDTDPVWEKIKPTELLILPEEGILVEYNSLLDPEYISGGRSEEVDGGARVARKEPIGYGGVTGISMRDVADGLYLIAPMGWSNLHVDPNLQCPFCK